VGGGGGGPEFFFPLKKKEKEKKNVELCYLGDFLPFKKNKIIKLAISRLRHFPRWSLGASTFDENVTTHLKQIAHLMANFNAGDPCQWMYKRNFFH
jgi:hypothetical protein